MNIFRRYGLTLALLTVLVIAVYVALVAGTGNAATYTRPPSATPARHLPTIPHSPSGVDYEVRAFTQAGSTMFAAGRFPYVVRDGVRYNAANIVGFNAITGAVTAFRVATDGEILSVTDTSAGLVIELHALERAGQMALDPTPLPEIPPRPTGNKYVHVIEEMSCG